MEEVEEKPATSSVAAAAPTAIPVVGSADLDTTSEEGFSILQKGLFFAVIVGCVVVYSRMNSKKGRHYSEKSMA